MNLETAILSAGQSSRMGQTKALLTWGGASFLEKILNAVDLSQVSRNRFVVTGFDSKNVSLEAEKNRHCDGVQSRFFIRPDEFSSNRRSESKA